MSRTCPVLIRTANAADHAAALGVTGSLTKPSFRLSKMFSATERSSVPLLAALIHDPCWSLRSLTGWQACCGDFVVPARLKRACLRCRANFYSLAGSHLKLAMVRFAMAAINILITAVRGRAISATRETHADGGILERKRARFTLTFVSARCDDKLA